MTLYVTVDEFKEQYKDIEGNADDDFITLALNAAQAALDTYLDRTVLADADSTEYFDYGGMEIDGRTLYLSDRGDICEITTVTNGDAVVVASSEYSLFPATLSSRRPSYQKLTILHSSGKAWEGKTNGDIEQAITVLGKWGMFSTVADVPHDFKLSVMELTSFTLEKRKSQIFDTVAIPDAGVVTIPSGWPATVTARMAPYRRLGVA